MRRRASAVVVMILLGVLAIIAIAPALIFAAIARRAPAVLRLGEVPREAPSQVVDQEPAVGYLAPVTSITSARSARSIADRPAAVAL